MLRIFSREKATQVDPLIDAVLDEMHLVGPTGEEYVALLARLERLYKLREKETPEPVKRDTVLMVAGNLLGILIIGAIEKNHVMTSKGFSQLIPAWKR